MTVLPATVQDYYYMSLEHLASGMRELMANVHMDINKRLIRALLSRGANRYCQLAEHMLSLRRIGCALRFARAAMHVLELQDRADSGNSPQFTTTTTSSTSTTPTTTQTSPTSPSQSNTALAVYVSQLSSTLDSKVVALALEVVADSLTGLAAITVPSEHEVAQSQFLEISTIDMCILEIANYVYTGKKLPPVPPSQKWAMSELMDQQSVSPYTTGDLLSGTNAPEYAWASLHLPTVLDGSAVSYVFLARELYNKVCDEIISFAWLILMIVACIVVSV